MDTPEKDEIEGLIDFGGGEEAGTTEETPAEDEAEPTDETPSEDEAEPTDETLAEDALDSRDFDIEKIDAVGEIDIAEDYEIDESVKKRKLNPYIKWSVIAAAILAFILAFSVIDTGIIGAYKRNFAHNFSKIFKLQEQKKEEETEEEEFTGDASVYIAPGEKIRSENYKTKIKSSVIIPYEYAAESEYAPYGDGIVCAATNYMQYVNSKGETEWECATTIVDPILKTAGDYILIAQREGTKLCLYNGKELLYDTDCPDAILNADLSKKGDCVLVTSKDLYKGAICAYNKSGKCIYSRSFGDGTVIDAAISAKSRNIAAALLYTDSELYSSVEIFDIMEQEPKASVDFADTVLFDAEYFSDTVSLFGDNSTAALKSDGELMYDYRFDDAAIIHYAYDDNGNKLLLLDNANVPTLNIYTLKGRQKTSFNIPELSDVLNIKNSRIMYNLDREIVTGRAGAQRPLKYTASMDIKDLIMVSKNTFFIVYSNSIELVKF